MSSMTSPRKTSSQTPNSPFANIKLPHRLPISDANYDAVCLKAQNIQLWYFRTLQAVVSFNPDNKSLMLYEYPAYSDANGVLRPVLAEDLAELRASNANVVLPSCWCPAAFTGNYCETIIFTMSPLANAEYENPGKIALHCAASQPKLRHFGCGFWVPIQELTSQGALGNRLRIPAPAGTNAATSPAASIASSSSLLHALDESFLGRSKRKLVVQPNGSPKKSRVLAPDSDTDFSPPPPICSRLEKSTQDTMFKAAFLTKGSLRGTSTIEEFFQGTATFPTPSLLALEEAYTSGSGISLQEFQYLTDYCLECGKLFRRLAHDRHICFEVSQTQTRRKRIPKVEKGKGKICDLYCCKATYCCLANTGIWRSARNKDNVYLSQPSLLWAPKLTHIAFRGAPSITHIAYQWKLHRDDVSPSGEQGEIIVGILWYPLYPTENWAETMYCRLASRFLQGRNLAEPTSTATCFALRRWIAVRISTHDHKSRRDDVSSSGEQGQIIVTILRYPMYPTEKHLKMTYRCPASRVSSSPFPVLAVQTSSTISPRLKPGRTNINVDERIALRRPKDGQQQKLTLRRCMNIRGATSTVIMKNCSETTYRRPGSEVLSCARRVEANERCNLGKPFVMAEQVVIPAIKVGVRLLLTFGTLADDFPTKTKMFCFDRLEIVGNGSEEAVSGEIGILNKCSRTEKGGLEN
ncbi:hypothetical protein IW261DRAFT_1646262 [Armillaria novae-zelandiae]|uniref:Uncharacterized protein n=1 Tax=Armillaria novae-zelandiae TaxID=153914 RepID=A0AA39P122_9AGAR|nr:hypothetical protein IW261DRAFT_1646262 [Armillaria novae-zelandiae]